MRCCSHCRDAEDFFSQKTAKRDIRRYRKRGPDRSTRLLLDLLTSHQNNFSEKSLLDIGGGVGVISWELFARGLAKAVNVDASRPYQEIMKQEAENREMSGRIQFFYGDFTELTDKVDQAEVVTLDRVICCYPDAEKLIKYSTEKAKEIYGVVYPRKRWMTRIGIWFINLWFRIRRSDFRVYLHPPSLIEANIKKSGFKLLRTENTITWHIDCYARDGRSS